MIISNFNGRLFVYSLHSKEQLKELVPLSGGNTLAIGVPNKDEIVLLTKPYMEKGNSVLSKYDSSLRLIQQMELGYMEEGNFAYQDTYLITKGRKVINTVNFTIEGPF